ncbi:MAG TPA: hypothetical protein VJY33_00460, partial [Isosphaeraceae bacterium]|nr:hypothetical protein [Isosphaeraceae bacterium]
ADLIKRKRIECLELVPALADALASHLDEQGENLGSIRLLAVGSDTSRPRDSASMSSPATGFAP